VRDFPPPYEGQAASRTDLFFRHDITDQMERPAMRQPSERKDPTENKDPAEPTLPMDSTEPTEPTESTEPREPIERKESRDHSDHRELSSVFDMCSSSSRGIHPTVRCPGTMLVIRHCG
jgi:hypothetical protein